MPARYALSVDPEEALAHMALISDITGGASSAGTSSAASIPGTVRVLVKRGDGGGGGGGSGNGGGVRERYKVTVACRQSPLLLGATSSSLRSSGGVVPETHQNRSALFAGFEKTAVGIISVFTHDVT